MRNRSAAPLIRSTTDARAIGGVLLVVGSYLVVVLLAEAHGATSGRAGTVPLVASTRVLLSLASGAVSAALAIGVLWAVLRRPRRGGTGAIRRRRAEGTIPEQIVAVLGAIGLLVGLLALLLVGRTAPTHRGASGVAHAPTAVFTKSTGGSFPTSWYLAGAVPVLVLAALLVVRTVRRHAVGVRSPGFVPDPRDSDDRLSEALRAAAGVLSDAADPRIGVIAAYDQMRSSLGERGLMPGVAETPREYLRRILVADGVPPAPLETLTGLFERAGFSRDPVTEADRTRAVGALSELAATLPR